MSMVEITNPTRQELYDQAIKAVDELYKTCITPKSSFQDNLDDISFYLMACPPQEAQHE
jgi:hypothetical protein